MCAVMCDITAACSPAIEAAAEVAAAATSCVLPLGTTAPGDRPEWLMTFIARWGDASVTGCTSMRVCHILLRLGMALNNCCRTKVIRWNAENNTAFLRHVSFFFSLACFTRIINSCQDVFALGFSSVKMRALSHYSTCCFSCIEQVVWWIPHRTHWWVSAATIFSLFVHRNFLSSVCI